MTEEEKITRDIKQGFEFAKEVVKTPKLLDKIPNGAYISFLDDDTPVIEKKVTAETVKYIKVKKQFEVL